MSASTSGSAPGDCGSPSPCCGYSASTSPRGTVSRRSSRSRRPPLHLVSRRIAGRDRPEQVDVHPPWASVSVFAMIGFGLLRGVGGLSVALAYSFLQTLPGSAFFARICSEWRTYRVVGCHEVRVFGTSALGRRGPRDLRCCSAQSGQRVWPGMAVFRQSLQRPDFFILRRYSAARARARSCRSSTERRVRFGFLDAFSFAGLAAAGFEALVARVDFAFGFAGFLVSGSAS